MHVKSISGTVTSTVTLGAGGYGSHLTITPTGAVEPAIAGATAIVAPASLDYAKITNQGTVLGAAGMADEGNGGAGIDLAAAGVVLNAGTITGGISGNTYTYQIETSGGTGVILEQAGSLSNTGTIAAGDGETEQQNSDFGDRQRPVHQTPFSKRPAGQIRYEWSATALPSSGLVIAALTRCRAVFNACE